MRSSTLSASALLVAGAAFVKAQTFTDCNPLDKTCPTDPALGTTLQVDFTKGKSSSFSYADGTTLNYGSNGAEFSIGKATDAPTISTNDYIFFGKIDVTLKAAPGVGIVSSFILESDDLDEIDWEWLGGNAGSVESNFFGKGNTTTYNRAIYHNVADAINSWHTYTIDWTSAYIKWYIDGSLVRTLNYGDDLALGGYNFPQTPMKVKMGNWVGCADAAAASNPATQGTCEWAGGPAQFGSGPFVMYVKDVTIQDYGCATEYKYGDNSGSYQSIQSIGSCPGGTTSGSGSGSSSSTTTTKVTSKSASTTTTSKKPTTTTTTTTTATTTSDKSTTTSAPGSSQNGSSSAQPSTVSTVVSRPSSASNGTSASTSTTPTAPPQVSPNAASRLSYGGLDMAVMAIGLGLGYLVM
ncbi:glycoside hydrolase family 16 protein [Xylogone sp. PMI_703]|nr:glycoside hydrolase family 16 protein [Xylogone sp. PMI_703]